MLYLKIQLLANSAASLAVQSPLGFSFNSSHHSLDPTSGEQAARVISPKPRKDRANSFLLSCDMTNL